MGLRRGSQKAFLEGRLHVCLISERLLEPLRKCSQRGWKALSGVLKTGRDGTSKLARSGVKALTFSRFKPWEPANKDIFKEPFFQGGRLPPPF